MSIPRTVLPKLAQLSHKARSVLLVAYAVADEYGEARSIFHKCPAHGQGFEEVKRSCEELAKAGIAKHELQKGKHVLVLLDWEA